MRALIVIFDGLGGLETKIKGKVGTPLELAKKEKMDFFAREGACGFYHPLGYGKIPGSDTAHLSIFGYDPYKDYCGRGVYEALGAGIKLKGGEIAFRANFATVSGKKVIDRRAGRNDFLFDSLEKKIKELEIDGYKFFFKRTTQHRGVVVVSGEDLEPNVSDLEGKTGILSFPKPKDDKEGSKKLVNLLKKYFEITHEILENAEENKERERKGLLKANALLLRGAGKLKKVESIEKRFDVKFSLVAGGSLYKGVGRYVGMEVLENKRFTGDENTDIALKFKYASKAKGDVVFLHLKATDNFGHDGKAKEKMEFIEKADAFFDVDDFDVLGVTGDHSTPCVLKRHSSHKVPLLLYGKSVRKDDVKKFGERHCMKGSLSLVGNELLHFVLDLINKGKKYGA